MVLSFYKSGLTSILPINQAGHHTHQTTTCVHSPLTFQPKAASANSSPTDAPQALHTINTTTGGDSICNTIVDPYFRLFEGKTSLASTDEEKGWPVKVNGVDRRPTNSESEKFNVASVARKMPRKSSEKD